MYFVDIHGPDDTDDYSIHPHTHNAALENFVRLTL